jgi:hypothetical protein
MRTRTLLMLYAVAMACLVPAFGQPAGAAKTETAAAKTSRFAKLRLGTKDAKLLVFAFDEADGPGAGYDTLRVIPVNFAASSQTIAKKTEAKEPGRAGRKPGKPSFGPFPLKEFLKAAEIPTDNDKPVVVAAGFSEIQLDTDEKIRYLEMMLAIAKQSPEKAIQMEAKGIPSFLSTWAKFTLSAKDAAGAWEYTATQPLDLAMTQTSAVLLDPTVKPGLELFADVVGEKLYIAAIVGRSPKSLLDGAAPQDVMIASITCDSKPEEVRVTVKDNAGKLVYQVAGAPDFFWPSVSSGLILQSKARCALPAKGKYHVEAIVNTGPLGGKLTAVKDVVCK